MNMVARDHQLIKARLGILAIAKELQNVVRTCKLVGISRSQFYAIKKAYELHGEGGLVPQDRRKPRMPNRTPDQIEGHILSKTLEHPTVSYLRLAERMKQEGIGATPAMVRYVWLRYGLSTRSARLQWLKSGAGHAGGSKGKGRLMNTVQDNFKCSMPRRHPAFACSIVGAFDGYRRRRGAVLESLTMQL